MMLLCVLLFSCMDAAVKLATVDYPIGQIVFFRNLVAFLPIVFYFTAIGAAAGALTLPFSWHTPDGAGLLVLVSIGLLGGLAQITMTLAFRLAPVALIAPFGYAGLAFAMGFGFFIWGDVPDA